MESTPSHAQSGTASKARARAMSDHTMIGSLGKRSTSTPANRPKSANGSASSAVRTPISSGVASSSRAPVSGRARKVICPPKWVMVSEPHSRTKSPWRHSPFNARMGLVRRCGLIRARSIPIHRPGTRFVRAIGRFVASPLPAVRRVLNLHAKGGIAMRRGIRLMALGIAVTVNGAALMAVNAAMVEGAERQLLSQQERLETGVHQAAARALYRSGGYAECAPFGEYRPDRLSVFMEKRLVTR